MNSAFRYFEDIPISEEQLQVIQQILKGPWDEAILLIESEVEDDQRENEGLIP